MATAPSEEQGVGCTARVRWPLSTDPFLGPTRQSGVEVGARLTLGRFLGPFPCQVAETQSTL